MSQKVKELPLWNEAETDVLPAFHFSYGHALFEFSKTSKLLREIEMSFSLRVVKEISVASDLIPRSSEGWPVLLDGKQEHFIFVSTNNCLAVFAPHYHFFQNQGWIFTNQKVGGMMILACRTDLDIVHYRIFDQGKCKLMAVNSSGRINWPAQPNVEVFFDAQKLHEEKLSCYDSRDRAQRLIANDIYLESKPDLGLKTNPAVIGEKVQVQKMTHFILEKQHSKSQKFVNFVKNFIVGN